MMRWIKTIYLRWLEIHAHDAETVGNVKTSRKLAPKIALLRAELRGM